MDGINRRKVKTKISLINKTKVEKKLSTYTKQLTIFLKCLFLLVVTVLMTYVENSEEHLLNISVLKGLIYFLKFRQQKQNITIFFV
jgi:hypothetical protein